MTFRDFLQEKPIYFESSLASVKQAYYRAGGQKLKRYELHVQIGAAGYKIVHTKHGNMIQPDKPMLPASTADGWVRPGSHLR